MEIHFEMEIEHIGITNIPRFRHKHLGVPEALTSLTEPHTIRRRITHVPSPS